MKAATAYGPGRLVRWPIALAVLATAGCQHGPPAWVEGTTEADALAAGTAGAWREVAMNRRWQNRPLSELNSVLGPPLLLMQIPGGGNPPGIAAVYGVDPASGCIDAFALLHGRDPVIRVYHCR